MRVRCGAAAGGRSEGLGVGQLHILFRQGRAARGYRFRGLTTRSTRSRLGRKTPLLAAAKMGHPIALRLTEAPPPAGQPIVALTGCLIAAAKSCSACGDLLTSNVQFTKRTF